MKKTSLFCSALLGFIIYEGSLSQTFAGKGSYRASGHEELGEVLKPSVWRQHQMDSERIQEELDRLAICYKEEQAAQNDTSGRVKDPALPVDDSKFLDYSQLSFPFGWIQVCL